MILAGDIGGTKTVLVLAERLADGELSLLREETYPSGDYQTLDEILELFLGEGHRPSSACFGVAGPVVNQRCVTTNLPWILDAEELKLRLGTQRVRLLNDLEAMAVGMLHLDGSDFADLNPGAEAQQGNIAVIAAGTGLGEAILFWDGEQHRPMATEGGHSDFAPRTDQQVQLLNYLRGIYPEHVSWERVVSGMGFGHLYDFLRETGSGPGCPAVPERAETPPGVDRNALISRLGVGGDDPLCEDVVGLFAELYGAEAGNLALKALAIGGLYIGGGIGPKIRPFLETGRFMGAFKGKGRFEPLLSQVPVKLALNPRCPLIGALNYFDSPDPG